ncbi:MAG: aminotransferase class V-fold PLP-dependent enzyme, partial [Thermodesulfobacteriota bacterium]
MNLDHNSGGRPRREAVEAAIAWLHADAGNPSSVHAAGRRARDAIEEARDAVAALIGARPSEVVFTSGGTEANNLALLGVARSGAHVVSTAIEHASVLRAVEAARDAGAEVTLLVPDASGRVGPEQLRSALRATTVLVSVGWANGEIGTVQPLPAIARELRAQARDGGRRVFLHSDAVQAAGLCAGAVARDGVDLRSL